MPYDSVRMSTQINQSLDQKLRAGTLNICIIAGINRARLRFMPPVIMSYLIPYFPPLLFPVIFLPSFLRRSRKRLISTVSNSSTPFDTYKILHQILNKSTGQINSRGYRILIQFTAEAASNDTEAKEMVERFTAIVANKFKPLAIEKLYEKNRNLLEPVQMLLENNDEIPATMHNKVEKFFNQLQQAINMPLLELKTLDSLTARAILYFYETWNNYNFFHGIEISNKRIQQKYYARLSPEDQQEANVATEASRIGELLLHTKEFNLDTKRAIVESRLFCSTTLDRFSLNDSERKEQIFTETKSSSSKVVFP